MGYFISEECTGCYVCYEVCPEDALIPGEVFTIDKSKCTECGDCVDACPINVIFFKHEYENNQKTDKNDKTSHQKS